MGDYQVFTARSRVRLAYARTPGKTPGVMFMGGFRSDMTGTKATFLEDFCKKRGNAFVRFDYSGHGKSGGSFEQCTIGDWLDDSLSVFDEQTDGPQVVVGSSMGGWLALLLALQRPVRVKGLVLLAPAPDFTEDVLKILSKEQKASLEEEGVVRVPSDYGAPYPLTKKLFTEAKEHLLLNDTITLSCPIRIIHGRQDRDVPWQKSADIMECLMSPEAQVTWVEDGDHRLSREQDLALIGKTVESLLVA